VRATLVEVLARALTAVVVIVLGLAGGGAAERQQGRVGGALQGRIGYGSFRSVALAGRDHYAVYLPPRYTTSGLRYPVVYFLHGLPAPPDAYRSIGVVARAIEESGRAAIVVGVEGARSGDSDAEWRDWGPGRDWESATAVELVRVIDDRYRTIPKRAGRVIIGVSAGGYGATLIADHHPAVYGVIESWSGYFRPTNPAGTAVLDLGSVAANEWADFSRQIALLHKRFARWWATTTYAFYVGTDDTRFRQTNEAIDRELRAYHVPHVYFRLYQGAHSWRLWESHAEEWLGRALADAAAPRA
jgi:S-formylglutathione hydrolase FrmB